MASDAGARGIILQWQREGLAKCSALNCEELANCYAREVGLLSMPSDRKLQLLQLVCQALREEKSRTLETTADGPALTELTRVLNEQQNRPLADAILKEGASTCTIDDRGKPGAASRLQ